MNPGRKFSSPPLGRRHCTRRTFLFSVLASLAAASKPFSLASAEHSRCLAPHWLPSVIADQQSAARLGQAYLRTYPQHRQCHTLIRAIEQVLTAQGSVVPPSADAPETAAALQQLVRNEYAQGEVVPVAGWILSQTEARLYALAALVG